MFRETPLCAGFALDAHYRGYSWEWLGRVEVRTVYIEPGSRWGNGYIESFNGNLKD